MKRARIVAGLLVCTALLSAVACDSAAAFIYTGRLYNASRDCLEDTRALDVLGGNEPASTCNVCLTQQSDAGTTVYVASMCAPFPPAYAVRGEEDALCKQALAAKARNSACLADGGASNPVVPDAGPVLLDAGPGVPDAASVVPDAGDAGTNEPAPDAGK
jgi:hypothetical protein